MLKLSKTQEKLAYQKNVGISVIKGMAQTGKTAVAMSRMIYLLEHACHAGERVLFICLDEIKREKVMQYLNKYYGMQNMSLFDEEPKGYAVVVSIDTLIGAIADKADLHLEVIESPSEELLHEVVKEVRKEYPRVKCLQRESLEFIHNELQWMNACGFLELEAYQKAARKGTLIKLPKKGSGRKALWQIKTLVAKRLKEKGMICKSEMQLEALQYLKTDKQRVCYEHIIVDDAEELTKVQLEFVRYLKAQEPGEVLFIMDKNESSLPYAWLSRGQNFKSIGYDMTGRVKHLTSRRKEQVHKKRVSPSLTPLELFMVAQDEKKQMLVEPLVTKTQGEKVNKEAIKVSKLPWYVETYKYINKLTGTMTLFQKDTSAGETYIDEVKQEEVEELPIYSDIAAGMPIEIVDEVSGKFEIPSELLHHRKNTYILHVQGDSMIGVDISDGDYVVIQAGNVNNNEIAAVYYNGATTLKRIVQEEEHILLCSENSKYAPIVIEDGDFRVMGKLIGVIKPL